MCSLSFNVFMNFGDVVLNPLNWKIQEVNQERVDSLCLVFPSCECKNIVHGFTRCW